MARIASLYLPWLGIVTENVGRLDYRKRISNKILKQPSNFFSSRYFILKDYYIYIILKHFKL